MKEPVFPNMTAEQRGMRTVKTLPRHCRLI